MPSISPVLPFNSSLLYLLLLSPFPLFPFPTPSLLPFPQAPPMAQPLLPIPPLPSPSSPSSSSAYPAPSQPSPHPLTCDSRSSPSSPSRLLCTSSPPGLMPSTSPKPASPSPSSSCLRLPFLLGGALLEGSPQPASCRAPFSSTYMASHSHRFPPLSRLLPPRSFRLLRPDFALLPAPSGFARGSESVLWHCFTILICLNASLSSVVKPTCCFKVIFASGAPAVLCRAWVGVSCGVQEIWVGLGGNLGALDGGVCLDVLGRKALGTILKRYTD
ncbi:unnamed protein product [Closterium sp. NIES-54]